MLTHSKLHGAILIETKRFKDDRGWFSVPWEINNFENISENHNTFVQDSESFSTKGTLRGLHFQTGEHRQAKLVHCVLGRVQDVILDLRLTSPTFGQWESFELDAEDGNMLYVPRGFAHGFLTLSNEALFSYKVDNAYNKESEGGIRWNDENLKIPWKLSHNLITVNERDEKWPTLEEWKIL